MKKLAIASFLALVGTGFFTAANAVPNSLPSNVGDLFIGFYNTGSGVSNDYLVDIGSASLYTQQDGSTFTLNIGNTAADLSMTTGNGGFGSTWFSGGKTRWGVVGQGLNSDQTGTLYAGRVESPYGTFPTSLGTNTGYAPDTTSNQQSTGSTVATMQADYSENINSTNILSSNSSVAMFQPISDGTSWYGLSATSPAFVQWTGFNAVISGTTTTGHALDLFQQNPSDSANPGTVYEGRFVISSTGSITYQSASAVPEPSTLTALAGGAGLLGLIRRRRAVAA